MGLQVHVAVRNGLARFMVVWIGRPFTVACLASVQSSIFTLEFHTEFLLLVLVLAIILIPPPKWPQSP